MYVPCTKTQYPTIPLTDEVWGPNTICRENQLDGPLLTTCRIVGLSPKRVQKAQWQNSQLIKSLVCHTEGSLCRLLASLFAPNEGALNVIKPMYPQRPRYLMDPL